MYGEFIDYCSDNDGSAEDVLTVNKRQRLLSRQSLTGVHKLRNHNPFPNMGSEQTNNDPVLDFQYDDREATWRRLPPSPRPELGVGVQSCTTHF